MDIYFQIHFMRRLSVLTIFTVWLFILSGCATTDSSKASGQAVGPITLAIWDFDNNSPPGGELDYLGKTLAEELLTNLATSPNIKLVEREQLRKILEEQHLSADQLASDETRLRLGRLAGANNMVFGSYVAVGDQIRLDVRVIEVETSLTKFSEGTNTTMQNSTLDTKAITSHILTKLVQ